MNGLSWRTDQPLLAVHGFAHGLLSRFRQSDEPRGAVREGAKGVVVGPETKVLPVFLEYLRQASQREEGLKPYRAVALKNLEPKRQRALHEVVVTGQLQRMMQSDHAILEFEDLHLKRAAATDGAQSGAILDQMKAVVRDEIARTERSLLAAARDSRLRFQLEQDYIYTP